MRQFISARWLAVALLAAAASAPAVAQDKGSVFDGTWKGTVLEPGVEQDFWIVNVETKDGKTTAKLVAINKTGLPETVKIKSTKLEKDRLILTFEIRPGLTLDMTALAPKEKMAKQMLSVVQFGGQTAFARFTRTTDKEVDPKKASRQLPEREKFKKVGETEDVKVRAQLLKALANDKATSPPMAALAGLSLVKDQIDQEKPDAKLIEEMAARLMEVTKSYGRELQFEHLIELLDAVTRSDKFPALAEKYSKVGKELLADVSDVEAKAGSYFMIADALGRQKNTLPAAIAVAKDARMVLGDKGSARRRLIATEILIELLKKADKGDEAKEVAGELPKLNEAYDVEFQKTNVPFEPTEFKGRKGKSTRVAAIELFTGAQCPPCVAADVAFDALLDSYKSKDVVFLQYHVHVPGPDPLTTLDSVSRANYYGIRGTPTYVLDGVPAPDIQVGGGRAQSESGYKNIIKALDERLETNAKADVKVTAEKKDGLIQIKADVANLEKPGEKMRLRLVLVEDVVRYVGPNGQRFHHHVVRDFPGGVKGFELKKKEASAEGKVDLAQLRKSLNRELDNQAKVSPFPDDERPMKLENLKVIAFVQNDETKEILNAVQVDVE